jgi:WD40 repeat protein
MTSPSISVSWSPDGSNLASLSVSALSEVYIWDIATEELLLTFPVLTQGTFGIHWSPRGDLLAVTTLGGAAILYDADTGEDVGAAGGTSIDWNPDGQYIVSGSGYDNLVLIEEIVPREDILDQLTGSEVMRLSGATSPNLDVDWSSDASRVASGEVQDYAHVWDAASGQLLFSQSIPNLRQVELSANGEQLATLSLDFLSLDGAVQVWDVATGEILHTATISDEEVYAIGWSPDGSQLASSAGGDSPDELVTIITVPNHETSTPTATDTSD